MLLVMVVWEICAAQRKISVQRLPWESSRPCGVSRVSSGLVSLEALLYLSLGSIGLTVVSSTNPSLPALRGKSVTRTERQSGDCFQMKDCQCILSVLAGFLSLRVLSVGSPVTQWAPCFCSGVAGFC